MLTITAEPAVAAAAPSPKGPPKGGPGKPQ
jgi:hypothetical protein